ncbi:hypothetical protein [Streptomyces sp. NPDC058612]|uniref:hypothetical protein n=1 Tax=Streptomyces sp. NPDC058612 TaxID=3346555 RepID=UPI0036465EA5
MNLHISAENALVFALSCLVAYVVYRRTQNHQHAGPPGQQGRGDLLAALTAGAAALVMFAFLFGMSDGSAEAEPPSPQSPVTGTDMPGR